MNNLKKEKRKNTAIFFTLTFSIFLTLLFCFVIYFKVTNYPKEIFENVFNYGLCFLIVSALIVGILNKDFPKFK